MGYIGKDRGYIGIYGLYRDIKGWRFPDPSSVFVIMCLVCSTG